MDFGTLLMDCFFLSQLSEKVSHHHPAPHLFFSFLPFTNLHLISSREVYGVCVSASSPLLHPRLGDVTSTVGQFQRTSPLCGTSGFKLCGVRANGSCPWAMLTATACVTLVSASR